MPAGRRHPVQVEDRGVAGLAPVRRRRPATSRMALRNLHPGGSYHPRPMADRRRLRRITDRLAKEYGRPVLRPHRAPVDELILTVLSQNTNDRNRDVAYFRLRERFPSWDAVARGARRGDRGRDPARAAWRRPSRCGSSRSSRRSATTTCSGSRTLRSTRRASTSCALPGVGRKTAACVLLFSFGRPDVPVDTHVYRVGGRLGLWPQKAPLESAHDELARLCGDDGEFAYETHVLLIRHGRRTCVARAPRCPECPLRRMCPEGRRRLALTRRADALRLTLAPALLLAVPFLIGIAVLRGPDRRDRHLPRQRRGDLPAADDPAASARASTSPTTRPPRRRCSTW